MRARVVLLLLLMGPAAGCTGTLRAMCVMSSMGTEGWTKCDQLDWPAAPPSDDQYLAWCKEGDFKDCGALLNRDWSTKGYEREARIILDKACDGGDGRACTVLASHAEPVDLVMAQRGCYLFDAEACRLGEKHATGAERIAFFDRHCDMDLSACRAEVSARVKEGDLAGAREAAVEGCRRGDDRSCYAVGRFAVGELP
jgi:hypothetical protein